MTDPVMTVGSTSHSPFGVGATFQAAAPAQETPFAGAHQEFQAFMSDVDSQSGYGGGGVNGGTVMDLVRGVDTAHRDMQSKLLRESVSPLPENIYEASVALSRFDLKSLFLSKLANKAFQAVDRLTNLQ